MERIKETMTVKTAKTVKVTNAPKNTFAILFFLRRDRVKPNGNIPIFCRITIAGDSTTFNLYTEVNPKIGDIKFNRAKGRSDEAVEVNKTLDNVSASVIAKYKELTDKFENTTAERIKYIKNLDLILSIVITMISCNTNIIIVYNCNSYSLGVIPYC